ncbi:MAG: carboxypeptidase regulatory-like domain-containing protein [Planctomycetota bacterium]
MPQRTGKWLVAILVLLAAALWLWNRTTVEPTLAPANGGAERTGAALQQTESSAAANASTADEVLAADRENAVASSQTNSREGSGSYVVTGSVLRDPRMPEQHGMRVLAFRGKPGDRDGLMPNMSNGPGPPQPAFVLDGEPIAAADVAAADGSFELRTQHRHLRLTIDHDYYVLPTPTAVHLPARDPVDSQGSASATRTHSIVLSPLLGAMVRGRLMGAERSAVDKVHIQLEPDPMSAVRDPRAMIAAVLSATRPAATPTPDGTFTFRAVAVGAPWTLRAAGPGVAGISRQPALAAGERRDVVLNCNRAAQLRAVVVDESGAPIEGALVRARRLDGSQSIMGQTQAHSRRTAADGTCRFDSLSDGRYALAASAHQLTTERQETALRSRESTPNKASEPEGVEPNSVRFVLREGGFVSGTVRDSDGKPLADARVAHHPSESLPLMGDLADQLGSDHLRGVTKDGARTDADGRFRLTGLQDDGTFLVVAAHDQHAPALARGVRMGDKTLDIQLGALARVHGVVVAKADGTPIPEFHARLVRTSFLVLQMPVAEVHVSAGSGSGGGGNGTFAFPGVVADSYTVRIEAVGFAAFERKIKVPEAGDLDAGRFELQRAASIAGIVQDSSGQPVANAMVRRRRGGLADNPMMSMMSGGGTSTYSDADGRFVLAPMPEGRLQLFATADGYASGRSERLRLAAGDQRDNVIIELDHGGTIRGSMQLGPGQVFDDFLVLVQHEATQFSRTADVSETGEFEVSNLDPGSYQVQAMPNAIMQSLGQQGGSSWRSGESSKLGDMIRTLTDSVVSERCRVRSGEEAEVVLEVADLTTSTQWTVTVSIGGARRLEAGLVEATSLEDGTLRIAMLSDGSATFGHVQPGRHRLQVRSGMTMTPVGAATVQEYPSGVDRHRTNIELPGGGLAGRVIDDDTGEPLQRAIVRLHHDDHGERDDPIGISLTDDTGAFEFSGLADGTYTVVANDALRSGSAASASRLAGIEVQSGTKNDELVLRARPAAGASVTVTSAATGQPLGGAMALCVDATGRPLGALGLASTDSSGKAWFGGMTSGNARIVARAAGFAPGVSDAQQLAIDRNTPFAVALGNGAPTTLRLVSPNGTTLRGANISARCGNGPWLPALLLVRTLQADGSFDLGKLGPGSWKLRLEHPSCGTVIEQRTIGGTSPQTIIVEAPR